MSGTQLEIGLARKWIGISTQDSEMSHGNSKDIYSEYRSTMLSTELLS